MKKLVFVFVAFVTVSFASCGNKANNEAASTDSVAVETIEEAAPVAADSAVACDSAAACCDSAAVVAE